MICKDARLLPLVLKKAASFIADEFKKANLKYWDGLNSYRQTFSMIRQKSVEIKGNIEGNEISSKEVLSIGADTSLYVDENSGFNQISLGNDVNLFRSLSRIQNSNKPTIVWMSPSNSENFKRLGFIANRPVMEGAAPLIFILHEKADHFEFVIQRDIEKQSLENITGVIPGKSRKDEYVVFSAHYDHLGTGRPDERGDSIYNGANDDASGTTAVIMLAKYFYDKSDFGQILQRNLKGSKFHFEPDPYPEQQLFF